MKRVFEIARVDREKVKKLSSSAGISELLARLLLNRGIEDKESAESFLHPRLEQLKAKELPQDMEKAIERLVFAIRNKERIGVYGDYDVDGISGVALLVDFLRKLGVSPVYYIPHRIRDGYGLKQFGIKELAEKKVKLILTVDCGVKDFEAVNYANELGIDVIVIDHHEVGDELVNAYAVIDPHREDCGFSFPEMSASGLAFYFLVALRARLRDDGFFKEVEKPNLRECLDLASLGTVADVSPVVGGNRVLVYYGLKELELSKRPGIVVLKERAGVAKKKLGYGAVAFFLAPRLNSAGRIDDAGLSVELLLTDDLVKASKLADELERKNQIRQRMEESILEEAILKIEGKKDFEEKKGIVVAGRDWHPGVIGIVAQRLVERYLRPCVVISIGEKEARGSCRSISGFDIYLALRECSEYLLGYGGHKMAAGLKLMPESIRAFEDKFDEVVREKTTRELFESKIVADAELPLDRLNLELVKELAMLEPFGPGNPEPIFVARNVYVIRTQRLHKDHLSLIVKENDAVIRAIYFRAKDVTLEPGDMIDLAYTPELDYYRGEDKFKIIVKDFWKLK